MLGRVWELADIDKDGMLDSDEFAVVRKKHLLNKYKFIDSWPENVTKGSPLINFKIKFIFKVQIIFNYHYC